MERIILLQSCWEILSNNDGYLSTFVHFDRVENKIVKTTYHYHEEFGDTKYIVFKSYQELQDYIDAKNEYELNKLESQTM